MTRARKLGTIVMFAMLGLLAGMTAASAGGGGHCEGSEGTGTTIELAGACFISTTSFLQPGETVRFVNRDPIAHNVSGSGWGHYEDMDQGDTFSTSFMDEGVYAFACTLHPGMTGSIVVGEGLSMASAQNAEPLQASPVPSPSGQAWLPAAAAGLLIGAAAGAGITRMRHDLRAH